MDDLPKRRKNSKTPEKAQISQQEALGNFLDKIMARGFNRVDPERFLDHLGAEFPLYDRVSATGMISERFESYLNSPRDRDDCTIPVIACAPGLGKTKLLLALPDVFNKSEASVTIVSYNGGGNSLTDFDKSAPAAALVLRVLYFGFVNVGEYPSFGKFLDFVRGGPRLPLERLRIDHILERVSKPLILAIDEFNYLLDGGENPLLKDVVRQLASTMQVKGHAGFFPVMAGTAFQPLATILSESRCKWTTIPLTLLQSDDVNRLTESQAWIKDWQTSRVFRHCLSLMGGLPRLLFFFLLECKKYEKSPIREWDFRRIIHRVLERSAYLVDSLPVASQLLIDVYLQTPIDRTNKIGKWTYGDLERNGSVLLVPGGEGSKRKLRVELPLLLVHELLTPNPDTPDMNQILTQLRELLSSPESRPILQWQDFETFMAAYQAIRISMLATLQESCSLAAMFPWGQCNSNTETFMKKTTVVLRPREHVTQQEQFDDQAKYSLDEVVIPGAGSVVDIVIAFEKVLVLGQTKRYNKTSLSVESVVEEASKVADFVKKSYLLLVISNTPSPYDDPEEIPDQCLVMGSDDLKHYLGSLFHDQVLLRLDDQKVNVNSANEEELEVGVPGVGVKLAKRIVEEQKKKPFSDWNDLRSRVSRLPTSIEQRLAY